MKNFKNEMLRVYDNLCILISEFKDASSELGLF